MEDLFRFDCHGPGLAGVDEVGRGPLAGDVVAARDANFRLLGLHRNLFHEANPIPVKWAAQQMGLMGGGIRLPLTGLSEEFHDRVRSAMRSAGIAV